MTTVTLRRIACAASLALVGLALIGAIAPATAHADTIYVDGIRGGDGNDGTVGRPYRTITKGLSMSGYGDEVRVAAGEYSPADGELYPLVVPPGVTLRGDRTPWTFVPDLMGSTIKGNGINSVILISGGNSETVVDGFVFEGAVSTGPGGAIRIDGGSLPGGGPVIRNCTFRDCVGTVGGAIYATRGGYGMCTPSIERCLMLMCRATTGSGGAISAENAALTISDCYFVGCNSANLNGGAISLGNAGGQTLITGTALIGCGSAHGYGGAIYAANSELYVRESRIFSNDALLGGAVYAYDNSLPLTTPLSFENCVFMGNQAAEADGGGIRGYNLSTSVRNCTLVGNTSLTAGGAIAQYGGALTVANSILWDNDDDIGLQAAPIVSLQHSCIEDVGDAGPGVIHVDPMLASLESAPRLLPGSPCVDTGNNATASGKDFEDRPRPADGDGDGNAVADMGAFERDPYVDRAAGADRYETAVAASHRHYETADAVVLATGQAYPDALCAAALCAPLRGPLLLTRHDELPPSVAAELERLGTEKIYLVGGESAISETLVDALRADGYETERIWGADRYATSRAIAERVDEIVEGEIEDWMFVARGDAFPDALSASAVSGWSAVPILLTRPDELPASTSAAITGLGFTGAVIVGGEAAVSSAVQTELDDLLTGDVMRVAGDDRYETSLEFVRWVETDPRFWGGFRNDYIGLATGANFPDALCGGPICGLEQAPLLLTRGDDLPEGMAGYLSDYDELLAHVEVFGGTAVVADSVLAQVEALFP